MSHLSGVALNVAAPDVLAAFYTQVLGMTAVQAPGGIRVGYGGHGAFVELRACYSGGAYQHQPSDRYWKIGITVPNVDLVHDSLTDQGLTVSQPHQFRDIGYMCHFSDPEGFQIELLQHSFEGSPRTNDGDAHLPLGGGAQIGQITLRTTDIEAELREVQDSLGMKLLSRQAVDGFGFDLYFLAFTDQNPPVADLNAVENRPWLWQRPYTTLEFQHWLDGMDIHDNPSGAPGFEELLFDKAQTATQD